MTAVEEYLGSLEHARFDEVLTLRAAVLASADGLIESVKWNAPSYALASSSHEATFRLKPNDALQLILHRGAAVRSDALDAVLPDPLGLVQWATPDRGVVTFTDRVDPAMADAVTALVGAWLRLDGETG
ncbi:DUF1801 domain-containing protein [Microbacteriaceae bacterium VKM Ac-2854]|nr:DUF1801 domain-containing protein [Microbacteriaceae bacterium VKM Ac-2854]